VCEYGTSPVQSCDVVTTCNSMKEWTVTPAGGTDCGAPLSPNCPATFDVALMGGTCSNADLVCDYPVGRCECVPSGLVAQPLVGNPPIMLIDASLPADHWVCQDPDTTDCPLPRPRLGVFCSKAGVSCDYGSCSIVGGTTEICQGGVWQNAGPVACPG
jgi:hypothetical protein